MGSESDPSQGTTERSPLLSRHQHTTTINYQRSRSSSPIRYFSLVTLIIPIAVLHRFTVNLSTTTSLRFLQVIACQLWYNINDPTTIPTDDAQCTIAGVDEYYAAIVSILSITDGVGSIVGYSLSNHLASRYGRKPVLLGMVLLGMLGSTNLLLAQLVNGLPRLFFLLLYITCDIVGNARAVVFAINVYILDTTTADERTVALSKLTGWASLGGALSTSLGGTITTHTHNARAVYLVSVICFMVILVYTLFFIPETLPKVRREQLYLERLENARASRATTQSWMQKMMSWPRIIFKPFEIIKPTYNFQTKKRNWRLVWCSLHTFITTLADGYAMIATVLYFSTRYAYTPSQTGFVLTLAILSTTVMLAVGVPFLVNLLKPLYQRKNLDRSTILTQSPESENLFIDDVDRAITPESLEIVASETSDLLDVHITLFSWFIESIAYISVGLTHTLVSQMIAITSVGLGAGKYTAFRSLVASSVDPIRQGEALAAIEMFSSLGLLLSPVVMGSILTSTISTIPQTIFYVHGAIVAVGAAVLFFVRDVDRFQESDNSVNNEQTE